MMYDIIAAAVSATLTSTSSMQVEVKEDDKKKKTDDDGWTTVESGMGVVHECVESDMWVVMRLLLMLCILFVLRLDV